MPSKNEYLYAQLSPEKALGIPLVEVDSSVVEETYCIASKKFGLSYINRYTLHKTIFLFGPYNSIRRLCIAIGNHVAFEICLILVVVANCVCLAVPELVPNGFEDIFTVFYCGEIMLQSIGRGFAVGSYSYLRNPWQCLDFIITMISLSTMAASKFASGIENIPGIKALRGLRALKAITRIPGVQTMAQGMLLSVSRMGGVSIIMLLFLITMTLLGKQLYMGVLLQKCVRIPPDDLSEYNETYSSFINKEENWQVNEEDEPIICGNGTGALGCDEGFVCLPNVGSNPDHGYSNFDNLGWAFLNTFRLLTQDAWEELYNMILQATGPVSVLYFIPIIFFGSFYLLNLIIAVVDSAYNAAMTESNEAKRVLSNYQNSSCFQFNLRRLRLYPLPTDEDTLRHVLAERDTVLAQKTIISRGWEIFVELLRTGRIREITESNRYSVELDAASEEIRPKRPGPWGQIRSKFRAISDSNAFRRTVFICIVVNTVFLASEHYGMSPSFRHVMVHTNEVLTTCFLVEAVINIIAYGKYYFYDYWNLLDFVIVMESVTSLLVQSFAELSFARSLRLLRLMKLSHTWPTLRRVITVILDSLGNIIRLLVVLAVMIFVFAVMGVRLLGQNYTEQVFYPDPMPRWSFATFEGSLFTVFQILTGEWVEPLWDCMRAEDVHFKCPFIIGSYFLIGNFVILNLFIALLLSSFDAADLQFYPSDGQPSMASLFETFFTKCVGFCKKKRKNKVIRQKLGALDQQEQEVPVEKECGDTEIKIEEENIQNVSASFEKPCTAWIEKLVLSTFFEFVVVVLIFGSCISLSFEDANLPKNPKRQKIVGALNVFFTGAFTVEMILKWIGLGMKNYFSDGWTRLDFVIVIISLFEVVVSMFQTQGKSRLSALKALRALRPLRFIPRWKGMQMVVTALLMSLPAIFRVILVCMFIWLTFAILGVNLFSGRLFRCVDDQDELVNPDIVDNKEECLARNLTWATPFINFDHIGNSYLALFQLAMFTGWIEIVEMVVDIRPEPDLQPRTNSSPINYLFIIGFIIVGGFLTLNLFVGVVVDTFKDMKKHVEGGVVEQLMTDAQKKYYAAMMKLKKKKPTKRIKQPDNPLLYFFYRITYNDWFQSTIMIFICLNALAIAIESYQQPVEISEALRLLDFVFQGVYTIEFAIKFIGMRQYYFYDLWNVFDFILWLSNTIGITLETRFNQEMPIPLSVIYAFRLLRILRLLHLVKSASDIRHLIISLLASAPALINISVLLFLIIFIYSIMGMSFFAFVKHNGAIDDIVSFATLRRSVLLLFRLTSAAGWEEVLRALSIQPPQCDPAYNGETIVEGNCGNKALAILFLLSFILLSNIILVNIFIAIILDSYENAVAEDNNIIKDDDIDGFYEDWAKYDPNATQFIHFSTLSDLLDGLGESLSFPKPNNAVITAMDLPITQAGKVHCLDVLQGIVKIKVGKVEETREFRQLCEKLNQTFLKIFPTLKTTQMHALTMLLTRQNHAAKVIQKGWRKYVERKYGRTPVHLVSDVIPDESLRLLARFIFDYEPKYFSTS